MPYWKAGLASSNCGQRRNLAHSDVSLLERILCVRARRTLAGERRSGASYKFLAKQLRRAGRHPPSKGSRPAWPGVHSQPPRTPGRRRKRPCRWRTCSTASRWGLSSDWSSSLPPHGCLDLVREVHALDASLPYFCIGGIDKDNVRKVRREVGATEASLLHQLFYAQRSSSPVCQKLLFIFSIKSAVTCKFDKWTYHPPFFEWV